tara:strand:- start:66 stop:305 length:240 start_codon:yes stop_codon:yes gene_type:complete
MPMKSKKIKFSKTPISDWKYGDQYEYFVSSMNLCDIVELENEYFTPEMTQAYDTLKDCLMDHKGLRKKFVKEHIKETNI